MRALTERGTPRGFQGRRRSLFAPLVTVWTLIWMTMRSEATRRVDRVASPNLGVSRAADATMC